MLNLLQLQVYNSFINPCVSHMFGDNQIYKSIACFSIAAVTYSIGTCATGGTALALCIPQCFTGLASLALSSGIMDILSVISNNAKTTVESIVEDSIFEEYLDCIYPLINITTALVVRQATAAAINYAPSITVKESTDIPAAFQTSTNYFQLEKYVEGPLSSMLNGVCSLVHRILYFGDITNNNQSNIVSTALDSAAFYTMLNGVLELGKSVFNMSPNNSLSVYDIKKIMSTQVGYKITREDATNSYNKFQACAKYYDDKNDTTKVRIDIITGIYSRAYGDKQKELIKKSISNELLDKSFKLIDMQIQCNVLQRLMNVETNLLTIKGCNEIGLALSAAQKDSIKNAALTNLNTEVHELKQLCDISQNEELTYKLLYLRPANIEVELDTLELMWNDSDANHDY